MRRRPLFSDLMLCGTDVSLGECPRSGAYVRLCLADLPPLKTLVRSANCNPGGQSQKALERNGFAFCKERSVEVSDPPRSE